MDPVNPETVSILIFSIVCVSWANRFLFVLKATYNQKSLVQYVLSGNKFCFFVLISLTQDFAGVSHSVL